MTDDRDLEDAQLVAAVAAGDERALGVLHDRYERLAQSIARRLLADDGAVAEVVQDAFIDLWRTAPSYDQGRSSVTTWLVRLVRLRAIDRARRDRTARRGGGTVEAALDDALQIAGDEDVELLVQTQARAERVRAALEQLSSDQRVVVELAFLEGLTHVQLAERLGLPIGTVKTRCFRGLARLAQLLADEHEGATR